MAFKRGSSGWACPFSCTFALPSWRSFFLLYRACEDVYMRSYEFSVFFAFRFSPVRSPRPPLGGGGGRTAFLIFYRPN